MEIQSPSVGEPSPSPLSKKLGTQVKFYFYAIAKCLGSFISTPTSPPTSTFPKRRRRSLPLPLPAIPRRPSAASNEACKTFDVLEDIFENELHNLHIIEKNLEFWQSREEGSNAQRAYFMICERGPRVFINGTIQLMRDCLLADGSVMKNLYYAASCHVTKRTSVLTNLRCAVATFLAEFYMKVEENGEDLIKDLEKSLPSFLVGMFDLFLALEESLTSFRANWLVDPVVNGTYFPPFCFARLPWVNQDGFQSKDCKTDEAFDLIYENLHRLDSYLFAIVVSDHSKPRKMTLYWMRYSCGLFGVSVCSLLLFRHQKLIGSPDADKTTNFWKDHLEQPIMVLRDGLFKTFSKRQGVMEHGVMPLDDSLHRMVRGFREQLVAEIENASEQSMLQTFVERYDKELMEPLSGLGQEFIPDLSLLDEIQMLMDIEKALFELDQVVRDNKLTFSNLVTPQSVAVSILYILVQPWLKVRVRSSRAVLRKLLEKIKRTMLEFQRCEARGKFKDAECVYGMLLYDLDTLHCLVDRPTRSSRFRMSSTLRRQ